MIEISIKYYHIINTVKITSELIIRNKLFQKNKLIDINFLQMTA